MPRCDPPGGTAHWTGGAANRTCLKSVFILPVPGTSGGIDGRCDALSRDDHAFEPPPLGMGVIAADAILGRFGLSPASRDHVRRRSGGSPVVVPRSLAPVNPQSAHWT